MNIIQHIEKFLGQFSLGWNDKFHTEGVQVVCFQNTPFESVDLFITIGLSHHKLSISDAKKVRQELIFPASGKYLSNAVVSCLLFISELILKDHRALLRGQVVRLQKKASERLGFNAVYCAIPVFMEDEFATYFGTEPPTVIIWIMPIYDSEAAFIDANGWSKFEDLLEEKNPDMFSFGRNAIT